MTANYAQNRFVLSFTARLPQTFLPVCQTDNAPAPNTVSFTGVGKEEPLGWIRYLHHNIMAKLGLQEEN